MCEACGMPDCGWCETLQAYAEARFQKQQPALPPIGSTRVGRGAAAPPPPPRLSVSDDGDQDTNVASVLGALDEVLGQRSSRGPTELT